MKLYVIDTNIVFSAILSPQGKIASFLSNLPTNSIELYAPETLLTELEEHFPKMLELSKQPAEIIRERQLAYLENIAIVSEIEIPIDYFLAALPYVAKVDIEPVWAGPQVQVGVEEQPSSGKLGLLRDGPTFTRHSQLRTKSNY